MKHFLYTSLVFFVIALIYLLKPFKAQSGNPELIKGITMVAPPKPFEVNPMDEIKKVKTEWVAIIPYAFSKKGKPEIIYKDLHWQWWGEKPEGILESTRLAKKAGLKIMLKPQVWMHDEWVGNVDFQTEEEWLIWERDYRNYLIQQVQLAKDEQVEMICIATEYQQAVMKRTPFFRSIIAEIRSIYSGKLCYSANWDQYREIPFWDVLDFVGISAYFPLCDDKTPDIKTLKNAWRFYIEEMESFSKKVNKPILFTEFGYLSVDGCAGKTWELEKQIEVYPINQKAQANAYDALFSSLWPKSWWAGGFVWKWFPNGEGHEGYPEKDYTPQAKEAEKILSNWFEK